MSSKRPAWMEDREGRRKYFRNRLRNELLERYTPEQVDRLLAKVDELCEQIKPDVHDKGDGE